MSSILPITLYLPCYNAGRFLDRVLPAAQAQTYPVAEIIAVDDGSTDDTADIARRHDVRVVSHGENRGLGATRNTGLHETRTEFVACLDADVVARPDWLARLVAALEGGKFAGACGELHETVYRTLADRWRCRHMRQSWGSERVEDPRFLFGNNGLYLRSALLEAGGYDETCRTNGEDATMTAVLKANGHRLVFEPRAACDHLRQDTFRSICRTYWRYHFHDQHKTDFEYLRRTRKRGRHVFRRLLRKDLRQCRPVFTAMDILMYIEWRCYDWSRYLGLRS